MGSSGECWRTHDRTAVWVLLGRHVGRLRLAARSAATCAPSPWTAITRSNRVPAIGQIQLTVVSRFVHFSARPDQDGEGNNGSNTAHLRVGKSCSPRHHYRATRSPVRIRFFLADEPSTEGPRESVASNTSSRNLRYPYTAVHRGAARRPPMTSDGKWQKIFAAIWPASRLPVASSAETTIRSAGRRIRTVVGDISPRGVPLPANGRSIVPDGPRSAASWSAMPMSLERPRRHGWSSCDCSGRALEDLGGLEPQACRHTRRRRRCPLPR